MQINYENNINFDEKKVCISKNCFKVEIADSLEERTEGLMFRESLDSDKGMLFVFDETGNYSFWMKNTLILLDIIWIDDDKVVHIEKNVQPCKEEICESYKGEPARYVLEINGGKSDEVNLNVGDVVNISHI